MPGYLLSGCCGYLWRSVTDPWRVITRNRWVIVNSIERYQIRRVPWMGAGWGTLLEHDIAFNTGGEGPSFEWGRCWEMRRRKEGRNGVGMVKKPLSAGPVAGATGVCVCFFPWIVASVSAYQLKLSCELNRISDYIHQKLTLGHRRLETRPHCIPIKSPLKVNAIETPGKQQRGDMARTLIDKALIR